MKAFILSGVVGLCLLVSSWVNNNDPKLNPTDFKEIVIGDQTWMAENLSVVTFRNGDSIREAKTAEEWKSAGKNKVPAWCYFDNKRTNGKKYGKRYNFFAVSDPRGLAPSGWQIPSGADWRALSDFLQDKRRGGAKLKSTSGWIKNGNGSNTTGFTALPSGSREFAMINTDEGFGSDSSRSIMWSSSVTKWNDVLVYFLSSKNNRFTSVWETSVTDGYSVRCIKK